MTPIRQAEERDEFARGTRSWPARATSRRRPSSTGLKLVAASALVLLGACTGNIGGGDGNPVTPPPSSNNTNNNPSIPPPPPANAPIEGAFATAPAPSSRFARLSHMQWQNTVDDLFKGTVPPNLSKDFLSEPTRSSFDNNGAILQVGNDLWLDYERAAEQVATAARNAPAYSLFVPAGTKDSRTFIQNFGLKAYRRPLTKAEVDDYDALFTKGAQIIASTDPFADGVEMVVTAMLQSVHFLYRPELNTTVVNGRIPLTPFELATRLSYSLTNSMPDDSLLTAAMANKLASRDDVVAQAKRLLESDRGKATLRDLHDQMMKLTDFPDIVRDSKLFPQWKPEMAADMKTEVETFVQETVFTQGKGLEELLTAPYTYANSRLAALYGANVPTPAAGQPDPFVKVNLDPTKRSGLYTQIGFLAFNATDYSPRSIQRGVRINLDVLCAQLPAPPNVPPAIPASMGKTNRQVIEALTESPGSICQACHGALINPVGFAFENFDGLGQYRTAEANGMPIDAQSSYAFDTGRQSFNGAVDLMKIIANDRQAHNCYAQHLFEYMYGRDRITDGDFKAADDGVINEIGRRSNLKASIKAMILDLVSTDAFLTRLM